MCNQSSQAPRHSSPSPRHHVISCSTLCLENLGMCLVLPRIRLSHGAFWTFNMISVQEGPSALCSDGFDNRHGPCQGQASPTLEQWEVRNIKCVGNLIVSKGSTPIFYCIDLKGGFCDSDWRPMEYNPLSDKMCGYVLSTTALISKKVMSHH